MIDPLTLTVGGIAAWAWIKRNQAQADTGTDAQADAQGGDAGPDYEPGPVLQDVPDISQEDRNTAAFLMMIRTAEGTADANGYRALFGHTARRPVLFDSFADHPRRAVAFTDAAGRTLYTSAAGAYQFLAISPTPNGGSTRIDTWDRLQRRLNLPDFSPESQDAAAVELIRENGALGDVRAGRFAQAVYKVRKVWASMPGAGYDQGERSLEQLQAAYLRAGGNLA